MMMPLMGLFMVGIPMAGFLSGLLLLCVRRLRFLTPFAVLMPVSGAYGIIIGFWSTAAGLSYVGAADGLAGISGLLMAFVGGLLGSWVGYKLAGWVYILCLRAFA